MKYTLQLEALHQPERRWALWIAAIGWCVGIVAALANLSPLWWGVPALTSALAWSLRRDAAALRRSVRAGRVWVCEGRVAAISADRMTLCCGAERVTLALTRPLPLTANSWCRLYLERGSCGSELIGLQHRSTASRRLRSPHHFCVPVC